MTLDFFLKKEKCAQTSRLDITIIEANIWKYVYHSSSGTVVYLCTQYLVWIQFVDKYSVVAIWLKAFCERADPAFLWCLVFMWCIEPGYAQETRKHPSSCCKITLLKTQDSWNLDN